MKNINTQTIFRQITLGFFLGIFLFAGGGVFAEEETKCKELDVEYSLGEGAVECKARYDCRWHDEWEEIITDDYGEQIGLPIKHDADCRAGTEVCRSINYRDELEDNDAKKAYCEAKGCWWKDDSKSCRPEPGMCEGRRWSGCLLDGDCRWFDGACILSAAKEDAKAVGALDGICNVDHTKTNKFWIKDLPVPCDPPITNQGVKNFCENHSAALTPYGKKQCRRGIAHVIKAGEQECLDKAEMKFQTGLKDSAAREQRRSSDDKCRANASYIYDGPVFEGGGLRSGAILAHENLTKSISHSTDLKGLIINWTKFILEIVAVIAVIAVIWAGILYITDMGDGGNIEKAKKILMWVAIGILVILGSYAIVNTLMKADFGSNRVAIITPFDA